MPTLTVEYKRAGGESVADAMDAIRKLIADKGEGVALAENPSWQERGSWVIASQPYTVTGDPVVLEPIKIDNRIAEMVEEAIPEPESVLKKIFKSRRKRVTKKS